MTALILGIVLFGLGWISKGPDIGGFRMISDSRGLPILDVNGRPLLEYVSPSLVSILANDWLACLLMLAGSGAIGLSGVTAVRIWR